MRKFNSLLAIFSIVSLISACATVSPERAQSHLQSWRGHALADMELAFGPRTSSRSPNNEQGVELTGANYAVWTRQEASNTPTFSLGIGGGSGHIGGGISTTLFGGQKFDYCTVQAFFDTENIVRDIRWNGEPALCVKHFPAPAKDLPAQP